MSAMKKSTSKKAASPAPAKKPAPVAKSAPVVAKPAKPVLKKTSVKAVASRPVTTTVTAQIDIGFGNALYIRGEGPGLSWDKGIVMECTGDDRWTLTLGESARPIVFKFLRNDEVWSAGEDFSAKPGSHSVFVPEF